MPEIETLESRQRIIPDNKRKCKFEDYSKVERKIEVGHLVDFYETNFYSISRS